MESGHLHVPAAEPPVTTGKEAHWGQEKNVDLCLYRGSNTGRQACTHHFTDWSIMPHQNLGQTLTFQASANTTAESITCASNPINRLTLQELFKTLKVTILEWVSVCPIKMSDTGLPQDHTHTLNVMNHARGSNTILHWDKKPSLLRNVWSRPSRRVL
jgi:hypothetical protein